MSQSSKSSGALRFTPIVDELEVDVGNGSCRGAGGCGCIEKVGICFISGVRALNTGGGILSSGLTGFDRVVDARERELEAAVEKSGISGSDGMGRVGGGERTTATGCDGPGSDEPEAVGRGTAFGVVS